MKVINFLFKLLPICIGVALLGAYLFSNTFFVKCGWWINCKPIETENISYVSSAVNTNTQQYWTKEPDGKNCFETTKTAANTNTNTIAKAKVNDLNCISTLIGEKQRELDNRTDLVTKNQEQIDNKNNLILENQKAQNTEKATATPAPKTKEEKKSPTSPTPEPSVEKSPSKTPTLEEKGKLLNAEKENLEKDKVNLEKDRQITLDNLVTVRQNIADRYSKRLTFMFFTAAFLLLCLLAILFSMYVIRAALIDLGTVNILITAISKMWLWQIITGGVAVVFFFIVWCSDKDYLAIVIPMYSQSITSNGDISLDFIHLINCIGFGTIVWVVGATSTIFFAVISKREMFETRKKGIEILNDLVSAKEKEIIKEAEATKKSELQTQKANLESQKTILEAPIKEKDDLLQTKSQEIDVETDLTKKSQLESEKLTLEEEKRKLEEEKSDLVYQIPEITLWVQKKFESYKRLNTIILYIGALMLFIGIVRLNLLADWHLIFVKQEFNELLRGFFNSSISVQAAFYSILLALIYLPVVYAIPGGKESAIEPGKNWFERLGLPISNDFLTKIIAVFSPLLATPIVDVIKKVVGE